MSSIIEGYNYEIFISYRQKDNKHDGWVTEFVDNLKGELEATFKEEISVYFDINPHDGLLETHDVDESLKEKLKCLIFIPIISRTYCDPKAFAWEHEFKAFVEQASNDQFGLKVKLPNGNVASRVLPIIIYDLDKQDIKLCESVLGGVLRGVDFIYAEPGVNRPLHSNEESPHDNLNHTIYRNQVNKVANTVKDILNSLTTKEPSVEQAIPEPTIVDEKPGVKRSIKKKPSKIPSVSFFKKLSNLTTLRHNTWRKVALIIFFLLVSIGAYWLGRKVSPLSSSRITLRYDIPIMQNLTRTGRKALAISHDSKYLVFVMMNLQLNLKSLEDDAPSVPIPGTTNSRYPFFSPDSKWIGYEDHVERKLMKILVQGGKPVTICDLEGGGNGSSWSGNYIIFAVGSEIYRVPDSGGLQELIYPLNKSEDELMIWNPQLLPDNKTLLFSQATDDGYWSIKTWHLNSEEDPAVLVDRGRDGRYLKSGYIAYSLDNSIYVSKFDTRSNRIVSEPQIIQTKPVYEATSHVYGASQFDFSDNGILVYYESLPAQVSENNLVWIEFSGEINPITRIAKEYNNPKISSDAQNIVADVNNVIEIINTKLGTGTLFVENAHNPIWSKDNSSIIYVSDLQVFEKPLDRSTPPVHLFTVNDIVNIVLGDLSPDGKYLTFAVSIAGSYSEMGIYDMVNGNFKMLDHYNTKGNDRNPVISPDGRWLAFVSDYSGEDAIYVAPFPGPGPFTRVSIPIEGGSVSAPIWAPDMTAIYYFAYQPVFEIFKVNISVSENFSSQPPESILKLPDSNLQNYNTYYSVTTGNIHPNGDRFLAIQLAESGNIEDKERSIQVIVNWEQELEGN